MNIKKFCEINELLYMPIGYFNVNGNKKVIADYNTLEIDEIKKNLEYINSIKDNEFRILRPLAKEQGYFIDKILPNAIKTYSIYLKHSYCYVIDIDDKNINNINDLNENYNIIKNSSWCKGNTKGIHIYIWCEDAPIYKNQVNVLNDYKGDFLNKNNVWENHDKIVYNGNNMTILNFEDIKHLLNIDKMNIGTNDKTIKTITEFTEDLENDGEKLLNEIIENYNIERSINYESWRNVGMALKSFDEPKFLELFIKFSSKSNEHKNRNDFESSIIKFWESFKTEGRIYNFFSLLKWLKNDNLNAFNRINDKYKEVIKKEEFYKNPIDTANYFLKYVFTGIKSVFIDDKRTYIYIFNDEIGIWEKMEAIGCLKSKISKYLTIFFNNCGPIKKQEKYLKSCNINEITDYIIKQSNEQDFINKLDLNRNVLNFKNVILNLKNGEFRKRTIDDYYSIYENYNYNDKPKNNIIDEIRNDFLIVCNNKNDLLNDYFTFYGYAITGRVTAKNLIHIGEGSNGKSTMADILIQHVLTKYTTKTTAKTFNKNESENNKSKLTRPLCNNKIRLCFVEEINDQEFDTAFFKMLSGSETYSGPELFEADQKVKPIYAKYIFLTNHHPNFDCKKSPKNNIALNRRFATIKHDISFYPKEKYDKMEDKTNAHILDPSTIAKYENEDYKNALLYILLENSIKFYENNESLIYKTKIEEAFVELNENSDPIKAYLEDRTIKTNNEKDVIGKKSLYDDFIMYMNRKTNIKFEDFFKRMKAYKTTYYIDYNKDKYLGGIKGAYTGIIYIQDDSIKKDYN